MGGKILINQRRQSHLLHLVNQQGDIVDALGDNTLDIVHTHSLAHLRFASKFARTVRSLSKKARLTNHIERFNNRGLGGSHLARLPGAPIQ